MAEDLHSVRYIVRLKQMSDRLHHRPIGKERDMIELRDEIQETLQRVRDLG